MTVSDGSDKDAVSMLVLVGDTEYVLRVSRGRVLFNNHSRDEASLEQTIILTLEDSHPGRNLSSEDVTIPIIVSTPSTPRFELSASDATSSPIECLLSNSSPRIYSIKFRRPEVCESDYAWDNFQDQLVIHTRLSKLVIQLEAWKHEVPVSFSLGQESSRLFPVSLPDVKNPPLRLFSAIERNADKKDPSQRHCAPSSSFTETTKNPSSLVSKETNSSEILLKSQTPRVEGCPSLSRPTSTERQSSIFVLSHGNHAISPSENVAQLPPPVVTAVESKREAREVILKLRRRRTFQSNLGKPVGASPKAKAVADSDVFPETVALDAITKAHLEEFNNLVVAAREEVTRETVNAKTELAYYQQLLQTPPTRESTSQVLGPCTTSQKLRISAAIKRPSKLPSLVRPSSGIAPIHTSSAESLTNQEVFMLEQAPQFRSSTPRQRNSRKTKLQSLSGSMEGFQLQELAKLSTYSKAKKNTKTRQQQQQPAHKLSDFDDPDPEVDDAPIFPDDLSGVATLEADYY